MQQPKKYKSTELDLINCTQSKSSSRWVPARPLFPGLGLRNRLKLAFGVIIGKYDVIVWEQ